MIKQFMGILGVLLLTGFILNGQTRLCAEFCDQPCKYYETFELDQPAEFPGGLVTIQEYLADIQYPVAAREQAVEGSVTAEFIVDAEGQVGEVRILRGLGYGCDKQVVEALQALPLWKPGIKDNKKVSTRLVIAVRFNLVI